MGNAQQSSTVLKVRISAKENRSYLRAGLDLDPAMMLPEALWPDFI
jgi:hypothetical protein